MRCTLLHRWRGSARGCHDYGPAAAPWAEKLRRGRWRLGMCIGWGQGPRPGPTPRGSCSERLTQLEETSAGAAKISHSGSAPEMKKPQVEPEKKHQYTCINKRAENLSLFCLDDETYGRIHLYCSLQVRDKNHTTLHKNLNFNSLTLSLKFLHCC